MDQDIFLFLFAIAGCVGMFLGLAWIIYNCCHESKYVSRHTIHTLRVFYRLLMYIFCSLQKEPREYRDKLRVRHTHVDMESPRILATGQSVSVVRVPNPWDPPPGAVVIKPGELPPPYARGC